MDSSRSAGAKLSGLASKSGQEKQLYRTLAKSNLGVQTEANLALGRWADAARAARELVRGRPVLDDTSEGALDGLAWDRALAAVALARNNETAETRAL